LLPIWGVQEDWSRDGGREIAAAGIVTRGGFC